MAKLDNTLSTLVDQSEVISGDFEPLTPGQYLIRLGEIEVRTNSNGQPAWNVEFDKIVDLEGNEHPGKQWTYLNLPINTPGGKAPAWYQKDQRKWETYQRMSASRLKEFFQAFQVDPSVDTDEIIGQWCIAEIGIETVQAGPRQGQKSNRINRLTPAPAGYKELFKNDENDDYNPEF